LEDQIEAVWTGHVNTRHAAFRSTRAGLSQVAAFTYTSSSTEDGLTLSFSARMFSSSPIKATFYSDGILQEAKEDMNNFIVDTSLELNKVVIMSTISWSWMAAITGIVLIFVILFFLKVRQMCQTAKNQADMQS
jgi:hypothetical protein